MSENLSFIGDNAIERVEDDLFNFEHYALKVQKLIQLNSNNSNPLTIGIYGKWGEGKTSFLNLLENKIDLWKKEIKGQRGILIYHFNPWRYSTEDEMLFDFFDGLAKLMFIEKHSTLEKVGKGILRVSKYLKAVKLSATAGLSEVNKLSASVNVGEIFEALGEDLKGEDITIDRLKDKVNESLKQANYKVVVFIDDIDRLDKEEIYTILKLIKLNGSFDNFIYIATMDSDQVSKAISKRYGNKKRDGKLFLEKIINIPIHLPRIEDVDLRNFFDKKITEIIKGLNFLDEERKSDEVQQIRNSFSPDYFTTPREIIRVFNSFFVSAFSIGEEVNLFDLFWIEYLKIKYPIVYEAIKNYSYENGVLISFEDTLDFNDDINAQNKPHGKRLELQELDKNGFKIVEKLFPVEVKTGTVMARPFNREKMKRELKINTLDNFDKYFSFHTICKISNLDIFKLKKHINEKNDIEIIKTIKKITKQADNQPYRVFYILEQLTKNLDEDLNLDDEYYEDKYYWYKFIFNNLNLVIKGGADIFELDYDLRLIELISMELNEHSGNKEIILQLAKSLNKYQLCHFTRKFDEEKEFKVELEKLVIIKLKEGDYIENPFYLNIRGFPNRYIMHYWKKHYPKEFENFLDKTINSKERLGAVIRNFVEYWGDSAFGNMSIESYKALKKLLFKDLIHEKINEINKILIDLVKINDPSFSDGVQRTIIENIQQFLYHYNNDKEN